MAVFERGLMVCMMWLWLRLTDDGLIASNVPSDWLAKRLANRQAGRRAIPGMGHVLERKRVKIGVKG
jgi:hypothetical protein